MSKKQYIGITKQLNIVSGAKANIDAKYGTYNSIQEAIQSIVKESRAIGLTVGIIENDVVKEYWWKTGIDDRDLILKIDKAAYTKISELENDSNYYTESQVKHEVGKKADQSALDKLSIEVSNKVGSDEIQDLTAGILFQDVKVDNVASLPIPPNKLPNDDIPLDKWGVYVNSESCYYQYNEITAKWSKTPFVLPPNDLIKRIFTIESDARNIISICDKSGRILMAFRKNGTTYIHNLMNELIASVGKNHLSDELDYLLDINDRVFIKTDIEGFIIAIVDAKERLLWGIKTDGGIYPQNKLEDRIKALEDSPEKVTDVSYLHTDKPKQAVRVDLYDFSLDSLTTSKNKVRARIRLFNSSNKIVFNKPCMIAYQGSSSMAFEKKNFSIDLLNDDDSSFKVKFGKWRAFDAYQLKAYYQDVTLANDIVSCRIYEAMMQSLPIEKRRPWLVPYSSDNTVLDERFDTGALGHVDGFPISVYINNEYWGTYTWNLKKNRDNYHMKKQSDTHIHLEAIQGGWDSFTPTQWETRSPKAMTDAANTNIQRFFNWQNTVARENFKAELSNYINLQTWIDYLLLIQIVRNTDSIVRNLQLCTWNGNIWSVLPYDFDQGLSMGSAYGTMRATIEYNIWNSITESKARIFWLIREELKLELESRYHELRNLNVVSGDSIINRLYEFMSSVGYEEYKRNIERWELIPSNRPTDTIDAKGNLYNGGWYSGFYEKCDWIRKRIDYLDRMFNYKK